MRPYGPLLALFALALAAAPGAGQQPSMGPLTSEEGAPLQRLTYTTTVEGAGGLERGRWAVEIWNGYSNIFEQDSSATHVLFLDMERLITTATVRWGASASVEVGARVALETTGAGALDGAILAWHDAWGFGNANRDRFPEDAYRQSLTDGNGTTYLDAPRRTLRGRDVRAFAKWRVARSGDRRSVLTLRPELRAPLTPSSEANPNPDVALTAIGRLGVGAWYLHGLLGVSATRVAEPWQPVLRGSTRFFSFAVERSLGSRLAVVAQFDTQSAALRAFHHRELDRAPTNLVLGLAGRLGSTWQWDVSFQEDVPADTPAVDFTVGVSVKRSW